MLNPRFYTDTDPSKNTLVRIHIINDTIIIVLTCTKIKLLSSYKYLGIFILNKL